MSLNRQHSFWGSLSPLGGLTGAGLLIMASARLSWAIVVTGSLFWVYGLTAFSYCFLLSETGKKISPVKGRGAIYTCLSALFGAVYLLLLWLLSPLAALENFLLLMLVPLFCAQTGFAEQPKSLHEKSTGDIFESVSDAVSQAASLAVLLIVFSIIREPLAYCSLSFPGSSNGMITIMYFRSNSFFPIGIFSSSAGALLLLGYFVCLYQFGKDKFSQGDY